MAQILHGRARTTEAVRREIQSSKESDPKLAKRLGINVKTIRKWKKRNYVHDTPMGPKNPCSTVLSKEEEAAIVTFRKKTLLPLDDCLYALKEAIPHLTRSSLHRCLKRHGISVLPKEETTRETKQFKAYLPGYFHVDITQMRTEQGKIYLFCAIDRNTKFVYGKLYHRQTTSIATEFLKKLIAFIPYKIQFILTDNGSQFTNPKHSRYVPDHPFTRTCQENGIKHRLTKAYHPWTNGQVERINQTIKQATIKKYHYKTHENLERHLGYFLNAYNFGKQLRGLKGKTPYEAIVDFWEKTPLAFKIAPSPYTLGPDT